MLWEGTRKGSETVPGLQGMDGRLGGLSPATGTIPGYHWAQGELWVHGIGCCLFLGTPKWAAAGQDRLTAQTQPQDMSDVSYKLFAHRLADCPPSFSIPALPPPPCFALPVPAIIPVLCLPPRC